MDKSVLLQQKVRHNADNLQSYMTDLKQWEIEMKKKESELNGVPLQQDLPPVRSKAKKTKTAAKLTAAEKRISSSDYKAWDKFDVDRACEMVDEVEAGPTSLDGKFSQKSKEVKLNEEALYEKEQGNKFVKGEKWDEAIKCYSRAIDLNSNDPIFFANRAQCYIKKENLHSAISDCTKALQLDPTYVKAYLRRSLGREKLGSLRGASEDLQEVLKLEPKNVNVKEKLEVLKKRMGSKGAKSKSSPVTTPTTEQPAKWFSTTTTTPKIIELTEEENNNEPLEKQTKDTTEPNLQDRVVKIVDTWKDGSEDGVDIVTPITKPPHLRSKEPLKRIEVVEIPIGTAGPVRGESDVKPPTRLKIEEVDKILDDELKSHENYAAPNTITKRDSILQDNKKIDVCNGDVVCNPSRVDTPTESQKLKDEISSKEKTSPRSGVTNNNIFEIPNSSVQFISQWKSMKGKLDKKSAFLSAIDAKTIPKIFRNSLESDLLGDILATMHEGYDFVESKEAQVLPYLQALTQVPRFSALTMFLSQKDKKVASELLEHCRKQEEVDAKTLDFLKSKFEV